jgi:hypothetical protein
MPRLPETKQGAPGQFEFGISSEGVFVCFLLFGAVLGLYHSCLTSNPFYFSLFLIRFDNFLTVFAFTQVGFTL